MPTLIEMVEKYADLLIINLSTGIRWCGISALGNINYENEKEYFTELLKTEQNKMIIALLEAHLRPLNK